MNPYSNPYILEEKNKYGIYSDEESDNENEAAHQKVSVIIMRI
jgi:hypothetical protein